VKPCLDLLFQLPQGSQHHVAGQAAANGATSAREVWALRMHRLCSYVQQQVRGCWLSLAARAVALLLANSLCSWSWLCQAHDLLPYTSSLRLC
jgi:hypothetical protein